MRIKKTFQFITSLLLVISAPLLVYGNDSLEKESHLHEKPSEAPEKVEVKPQTRDSEIAKRLKNILQATNWFTDSTVDVQDGVVFLGGEAKSDRFKEWAGDLARNTQDVVAVVNKITVGTPSIWDSQLILKEFLNQGKKVVRALPEVILGLIVLILAWLVAKAVHKLVQLIFRNRMNSSLLNQVIAKAAALFVFLFGLYFVFEMADLTTAAVTIISGTGILGIILGIAFRDLVENFLASILLSLQDPFQTNDLIDLTCPVTGYAVTGYVERLTMRATILISQDGNQVQIPNATVYKSNIVNYSSNPIHREAFLVRIGLNNPISKAIDSALKVILGNEDILKNPEPLVLVKELEQESVCLQICYWVDINKHNPEKVKSSVIRFVKHEFQSAGIYQFSNPLAPQQDPVYLENERVKREEVKKTKSEMTTAQDKQIEKIKELSRESRQPEKNDNLLDKNPEEEETKGK